MFSILVNVLCVCLSLCLVKLECLAAQSVLVLCCRLNKKKNTSCKEKISGILLFSPTDSGKKTNTIHNIIPFCLFRKFVQKIKTKKYKNTYSHTKEGRRNARKNWREPIFERCDINLHIVCLCLNFYNFRGIEQKATEKSLFNAGHLQIVNSFLIVQQTKQHTAPSLAMRSECVDWSVVTANHRFFFSTNFPLEIEYPFINH